MKNNRGFTLIEVMIAVVIVAILAAVAFPSYQDSVRKSRRAEAKTSLLQVAQILEQCFTEFNNYNTPFVAGVGCRVVSVGPPATISFTSAAAPLDGEGYYTITSSNGGETLTATSYTLSATPTNLNNQDDDTGCPLFTLDNTGVKNLASNCW